MAKKIKDENGNTYVQKKPFYKRVWFWLLAVIVVIGVGGAIGGNKSDNGGAKVSSSSSSKKATPKYYKLGDTVKVGDVTYTLKSVATTQERNEFADDKPANVIVVTYHVKNNSNDDLPVGADLNAYDSDNNKMKTYPINGETVDAVAAGKEMDVTAGYGLSKLGVVELQFAPLVSVKQAAKFKVTVQ